MEIETRTLSDEAFDEVLERFALVDDGLVLRSELARPVEPDEVLDRYTFTGLVEALRSDEFEESALETAAELEIEEPLHSEDEAWVAVRAFYAERACLLLRVGEGEEFIIGHEVAARLGLLGPDAP